MTDGIEQMLADALGPEGAARAGDDEHLRALIESALATPITPPPSKLALKLVVGGGAIVAGAALLAVLARAHQAPAPTTTTPTASSPVESASAPPPEIIVTTPQTVFTAPIPSTPPMAILSAERLFSRANDERRKNRDGDAIEDYRTLERTFPTSPEAVESHVALGRLLLDKRGNAAAALLEFDRYLQASTSGTLKEEALIGRALSLARLGREDEARRAWQLLLDTYPDSIYADQARAHLAPR